jgi:hypothetical protein
MDPHRGKSRVGTFNVGEILLQCSDDAIPLS